MMSPARAAWCARLARDFAWESVSWSSAMGRARTGRERRIRRKTPTRYDIQSADGLAFISCPAAIKPTRGVGIPFHVGDAPLLAGAEQLQNDLFGFAEIQKGHGSDRLGRTGILHINGKVRNVPFRAADERIAVEHRRPALLGRCGAILQNERSQAEGEVAAHRLVVGEWYPGGSGGRFAEIMLIDGG